MAFLSSKPADHGLIDFSGRSYGGVAYRVNTLEKIDPTLLASTSQSSHERFITEHNLALFWRRPGLRPSTCGFPLPLLNLSQSYAKGIRSKPPGNIRSDTAPVRYRGRNLLTGRWNNSNDAIRLWAVNDMSDHKSLIQHELTLHRPHRCKPGKLLLTQVLQSNPIPQIALPHEALELRAGEQKLENYIFLRSKQSLAVANCDKDLHTIIFNSSIISFIQIPHMDEEVAIVDSANLLFTGNIETGSSSFSRFKTPLKIKSICHTDCPRLLIAMCDKELYQLDLRVPRDPGQLIYSHFPLESMGQGMGLSEEIYQSLTERDYFCHVHYLDLDLDSILLTTTRHHILLDRRLPGRPLLSLGHSEMEGSDYCITTPPFFDPETNGRVYSLYSLTQVRRPGLSHWSMIYHPREKLWSSLQSKYQMLSPRRDIPAFAENHYQTINFKIERKMIPNYTRAFHYQVLPDKIPIGKTRALLFRQMDNGEIWYDNIMFDPLTPPLNLDEDVEKTSLNIQKAEMLDQEYAYKRQSLEQISSWLNIQFELGRYNCYHEYFKGVNKRFIKKPESDMRVLHIKSLKLSNSPSTDEEMEDEESSLLMNRFDFISPRKDPFASIGKVEQVDRVLASDGSQPEILPAQENEKAPTLSGLIMDMWQNAECYYKRKSLKRQRSRDHIEQVGINSDLDEEEGIIADQTEQEFESKHEYKIIAQELESQDVDFTFNDEFETDRYPSVKESPKKMASSVKRQYNDADADADADEDEYNFEVTID